MESLTHPTTIQSRKIKAVGLISGGLDSTVAAKVVKDLGVEVHGVYFSMPWGCCDKVKAQTAAHHIGIPLVVLQLDERYLEVVKKPKYGYGSALNPCVDCRIHMFSRAGQYMQAIGADFVFSGEVLGQRPMSQLRHSMKWIEKDSGLEGRLLRPLCAQYLDPTIPETEGLIDRSKLLNISGRSRREQMDMAEKFGITDYPAPAGGCLLTDENFARRMKDTFQFGYRDFRETIALKWGRHFRINPDFKVVLGRDEVENDSLMSYAHMDDYILRLPDEAGPTLVLKGSAPSEDVLAVAAGFIQNFSRYKNQPPQQMHCWPVRDKNEMRTVTAKILDAVQIESMRI